MIILDTNVVSALMRNEPDPAAIAWLDSQPRPTVWTTAVTIYEIRLGLRILPKGRRRTELSQLFERLLAELIEDRIAALDEVAADHAATLEAEGRMRGQPRDLRDTFIAGIVLANNATLATRNVRHFQDLGARVVNPWADARGSRA